MNSPEHPSLSAKTVTGRFAPSPTGPLHYGSMLAAVASYLNIRSKNGIWLVRIDDLDPPREMAGAASDILHTLDSFGLHWDRDVVYQSRRLRAYDEALLTLQQKELLYPCSCSRKDIIKRGETVYTGHCRNGHVKGQQDYAIRIKVPKQTICWNDIIQGPQSANLFQDYGDFIVRRADRLHAYHLAVVLDDANQGITESIRGADLLPSTSVQMYLQQVLDIKPPQYAHIPVAVNSFGEKLSKQSGAAPVAMRDPARTLFKTLQDLGQTPPQDLESSSTSDILHWGEKNWDLQKISASKTL
jgi:glutamyl-Q tRNA(Asp) synthetase